MRSGHAQRDSRNGGQLPGLDDARRLEMLLERGDDGGVELRSGMRADLCDRRRGGGSRSVAPLGGDGIVGVGDEDDSRPERNLRAREPG